MAEKNYILFDDDCRDHLLPLTFTRPVAEIRIGILTIREKWERSLNAKISFLTQDYLGEKFPLKTAELNWLINGSVLPDPRLVAQVLALQEGESLIDDDILIAAVVKQINANAAQLVTEEIIKSSRRVALSNSPRTIRKPTDIFSKNAEALRDDFKLVTYKRRTQPVYESNRVVNRSDVFIEQGAVVELALLNASNGPIYIGRGAEVMEGAMIRGPFSLGEKSIVKMGAKIYGPTTIGPVSTVGGEVNNSVVFGYSNKGHEGFLGNAVIGEWCNIGADTNNSNLKNDYGEVRLWDYTAQSFVDTGMQFVGLIMGDHSKCGINTMFNTGTVVGVFANIFGGNYQPNFLPSFIWGNRTTPYKIEHALDVARRVMARRGLDLTEADEKILRYICELKVK